MTMLEREEISIHNQNKQKNNNTINSVLCGGVRLELHPAISSLDLDVTRSVARIFFIYLLHIGWTTMQYSVVPQNYANRFIVGATVSFKPY